MIPVGNAVAVQNQAEGFPKKWDKTGVVMENMDHDKVLIRMDGSRRLTTRNRRFVKKILSPPDVPDQELPDVPPSPVHRTTSDLELRAAEDDIPLAVANENSSNDMSGEVSDYGAHGIDNVPLEDMQPPLPVSSAESSGDEIPSGGRPKRIRRPNVKYGSEEYDLSAVSACKSLVLSGLYVKKSRPMDRGRC